MGKLAKIELGKTASDAFAGCAPLQWLGEVASDFAKWVGKGIWDLGKSVVSGIKNFFSGSFEWLGDLGKNISNWVGNLPGVKQVRNAIGVMVAAGKSVLQNGCVRAALVGIGVVGALGVTAAGISYLAGTGFLGGVVTALTLGVLTRFCLRGIAKAWRFNWNISDEQISQRYKNSVNSLAASAGSVVGAGLAHFACGVGGAAAVVSINPTAAALCKEVLGESWDEVVGNAKALIRNAFSATEQWITLELFKNMRSAVKKIRSNKVVAAALPDNVKKAIDYWGSPNSKPWSFATSVEEAIEKIEPKPIALFLEEAREEFAEVCSQATYALSYGL